MHSENGSVDIQIVSVWMSHHTDLLNEYHPKDISNTDNWLGLVVHIEKISSIQAREDKNGKNSFKRLVILFCCSPLSKKLLSLVIRK